MSYSKSPTNLSSLNEIEFQNWLDSFDVVLIDCDGKLLNIVENINS